MRLGYLDATKPTLPDRSSKKRLEAPLKPGLFYYFLPTDTPSPLGMYCELIGSLLEPKGTRPFITCSTAQPPPQLRRSDGGEGAGREPLSSDPGTRAFGVCEVSKALSVPEKCLECLSASPPRTTPVPAWRRCPIHTTLRCAQPFLVPPHARLWHAIPDILLQGKVAIPPLAFWGGGGKMHAVGVGVGLLDGGNTRVKVEEEADEEADDKVEEEVEMSGRRLRSCFACSLLTQLTKTHTRHTDTHMDLLLLPKVAWPSCSCSCSCSISSAFHTLAHSVTRSHPPPHPRPHTPASLLLLLVLPSAGFSAPPASVSSPSFFFRWFPRSHSPFPVSPFSIL